MPPKLLKRFQARFLRELFRSPRSGFVLKGGLALNALYGSSRLTMDIDLDFPPHAKRTAESLHAQTERAIRAALTGMPIREVQIAKPGKAEISPKWKVSGVGPDGSPFNVRVEVSRRPPVPAGPIKQHALRSEISAGLPVFYVDIYEESTLAAMKLAALVSPNRHALRDVYDLDLLIADGHRPGDKQVRDLLAKHQFAENSFAELLEQKLNSMSWDEFSTQVLTSMEPDLAGRLNSDEWERMKRRLLTAARQWLQDLEEFRS